MAPKSQYDKNLGRVCAIVETLRSTTQPVRQRASNFSLKMSPKLFDTVKV